MSKIPAVSDAFWKKLIHNEIEHEFCTLAIQMYVSSLVVDCKLGFLSEDEVIKKLHSYACKFPKMFFNEFEEDNTPLIQETKDLFSLEEVIQKIEANKFLIVLGNDQLLKQLPKGNWIGVSAYYFMTKEKGLGTNEKLYVQDLSGYSQSVTIKSYNKDQIQDILRDRIAGGFTYLLMPPLTEVAQNYATEVLSDISLYNIPIVGFIGGAKFEDVQNGEKSYCYNGATGDVLDKDAIAIHVQLKEDFSPRVEIINIFEPNLDGPRFSFEENSFVVTDCTINKKKENLYDYMIENNIGRTYPLVSNHNGALLNCCIFQIDEETKTVYMASPTRKGKTYYLAKPFEDYVEAFQAKLNTVDKSNIVISFNCYYNYLFGKLEGKKLEIGGPITYGEIAYQLLNQTMVYLCIDKS